MEMLLSKIYIFFPISTVHGIEESSPGCVMRMVACLHAHLYVTEQDYPEVMFGRLKWNYNGVIMSSGHGKPGKMWGCRDTFVS